MGNKDKKYIIAGIVGVIIIIMAGVYFVYRYTAHSPSTGSKNPPVAQSYNPYKDFSVVLPAATRIDISLAENPLSALTYNPSTGLQHFLVIYKNDKKGDYVLFSTTASISDLMAFYTTQNGFKVIKKDSDSKHGFVELNRGANYIRVLLAEATGQDTRKVTIQSILP